MNKKAKKTGESSFSNFFPEKKAMETGMLVIIIITLVSFVLIAYSIREFVTKAEPKEAEVLCHDSLAVKASTRKRIGPVEISTPSLCKTIDQTFSAETKEEASEFISRKMERCWWIWLEGRFSQLFGPRGLGDDDDKAQCFVCYNLIYEEGPTISNDDLLQGLIDANAKYRADGNVVNYIQETGYFNILENTLESRHVYSVIFASNIEEDFWENTFARSLGFYPEYNKNGIWLTDLQDFEQNQPCYDNGDKAGE